MNQAEKPDFQMLDSELEKACLFVLGLMFKAAKKVNVHERQEYKDLAGFLKATDKIAAARVSISQMLGLARSWEEKEKDRREQRAVNT